MKNKKDSFSIKEIINEDKDIKIMAIEKPKKEYKISTANDFFTQYKDPKWQRKRLEVMQRDEFMCYSCQSTEKTLNVHHCIPYKRNIPIWQYDNEELITLCEDCHKELSELIFEGNKIIMSACKTYECGKPTIDILRIIDHCNPWQLDNILKMIQILEKY